MGGVDTDVWGRTSLPGLYAAGEVACTWPARRQPAGQQLSAEGLVFGARAALAMVESPQAAPLAADRVVADGSGLMATSRMAMAIDFSALSHQPLADDEPERIDVAASPASFAPEKG